MKQLSLLDAISEKKDEGYICPSCSLFVKRYTRKLNSSMALVLIEIYRSGEKDYIHVENFLKKINKPGLRADFHKLVHWNLLAKKIEKREDDSKRNGFYKITLQGEMFVEGKITVPESVLIFNGEFEGFKGKQVNIIDVLGTKFNYKELMENT